MTQLGGGYLARAGDSRTAKPILSSNVTELFRSFDREPVLALARPNVFSPSLVKRLLAVRSTGFGKKTFPAGGWVGEAAAWFFAQI